MAFEDTITHFGLLKRSHEEVINGASVLLGSGSIIPSQRQRIAADIEHLLDEIKSLEFRLATGPTRMYSSGPYSSTKEE